jgi:hypothetical protein
LDFERGVLNAFLGGDRCVEDVEVVWELMVDVEVEVEVEVDEDREWDEVLLRVSAAELGVRRGSEGVSMQAGSTSKT